MELNNFWISDIPFSIVNEICKDLDHKNRIENVLSDFQFDVSN